MLGLAKFSQGTGGIEPYTTPLVIALSNGGFNTMDYFAADISNPSAMNEEHSVRINNSGTYPDPQCVVYDPLTHHLIAAGANYIYSINCRVPTRIGLVSSITGPGNPTSMKIDTSNSIVYIVDDASNTLRSYDVSDPTDIVLLDSISTGGGVDQTMAIDFSRDLAYVVGTAQFDNFCIVDISDPENLSVSSNTTVSYGSGIAFNGNYVYIKTGGSGIDLVIANTSNPAAPTLTYWNGATPWPGTLIDGYGSLLVNNSRLYMVGRLGGNSGPLTVFSLSNPTNPVITHSTPTGITVGAGGYELNLYNNVFYCWDNNSDKLVAIDISSPDAPFLASSLTLDSNPYNGNTVTIRTPDV